MKAILLLIVLIAIAIIIIFGNHNWPGGCPEFAKGYKDVVSVN